MKTINLMIVEDTQIMRDGLKAIFDMMPGFKVVALAEDGEDAIYFADKVPDIDVVLMDVGLPGIDGIEATIRILEKHPDLKILGQTLLHSKVYVKKMVQAGAKGMILKASDQDEFARAIRTVYEGEYYYSNGISHILLQDQTPPEPGAKAKLSGMAVPLEQLTPRELEVLKLLLGQFTTDEIAEYLNISSRTVETHRRNLLGKAGARKTIGLSNFAQQHRIVFDPDEFPGIEKMLP